MHKNQIALTSDRREKMMRFGLVALVMIMFLSLAVSTGIVPALAVDTTALDTVMDTVLSIISTAANIIGVIIILWGVFQMILAFRREDSEGISKQITTIVVGGVLVGFGLGAPALYDSLA